MYNKHKIWKIGDKLPTATNPVCAILVSVQKETKGSNGVLDVTGNRRVLKPQVGNHWKAW